MHISELYAAGIGFTILSQDSDFLDSGELRHCEVIVDADYVCFDGVLVDTDDEYVTTDDLQAGLSDVNELRDDAARWEHLRDAHLDELLAELQCLSQSDKLWDEGGKKLPAYGEMSFYALERQRRYYRLCRYIFRLPRHRYTAVRRAIWAKYKASVQLAAQRGEWYLLLLTKAQVSDLMDLLR